MRLVLLGAPGAGKGTQGRLLADRTGVALLGTGDMLRSAIAKGTPLGKKAAEYVTSGRLAPDDLILALMREEMARAGDGFLLDGFPRTIAQAEVLDRILEEMGLPLDAAVYLEMPTEVLAKRLADRWTCPVCAAIYRGEGKCDREGAALVQREDDRPETVRHRLEVYEKQTKPIVEYYRGKGLLREVNGDRDIEAVYADLAKSVRP